MAQWVHLSKYYVVHVTHDYNIAAVCITITRQKLSLKLKTKITNLVCMHILQLQPHTGIVQHASRTIINL